MHTAKFIEWLGFHPTPEEIARALATEYFAQFGILGVRIVRTNSDDSILLLGQHGYSSADKYRNRTVPGSEWRAIDSPDIQIISGAQYSTWSSDSTFHVFGLRDRGVSQGYIVIEFHQPVEESQKSEVAGVIEHFAAIIALYLSFSTRPVGSGMGNMGSESGNTSISPGLLTQRQLVILGGMVEGKTNHELAIEMGFSVSTVRHETMRIFQALSVSDRKEAAKKALELGLL